MIYLTKETKDIQSEIIAYKTIAVYVCQKCKLLGGYGHAIFVFRYHFIEHIKDHKAAGHVCEYDLLMRRIITEKDGDL